MTSCKCITSEETQTEGRSHCAVLVWCPIPAVWDAYYEDSPAPG